MFLMFIAVSLSPNLNLVSGVWILKLVLAAGLIRIVTEQGN